jgi:hypothetical protein
VTVYFLMAHHGGTPIRVGPAHSSREAAAGWRRFVSAARHARVTIERFDFERGPDGKLDPKAQERLDKRYNMDAP